MSASAVRATKACGADGAPATLRIAILGARGIPASYGGFETFAEQLATRLALRGHQVTVYAECGDQPVADIKLDRIVHPTVKLQHGILRQPQKITDQRPGATDRDRDLDRDLAERVGIGDVFQDVLRC